MAIDKPVGMSSHDVVNRVRRAFGEKRVGHAGTLDPLASGVLLVGVGQATRLSHYLTSEYKSYVATIVFGRETTTDDAEGETRIAKPVPASIREQTFAEEFCKGLVGVHEQVPPDFSAIHAGGQRAYDLARAGKEVTLKPRTIEVTCATLLSVGELAAPSQRKSALQEGCAPVWRIRFEVSKGTYIRSLARDIGRALGTAAYLGGLERTESGGVGLASCVSLDELMAHPNPRELAIDPVAALGCACMRIDSSLIESVAQGKRIELAPPVRECRDLIAIVSGDRLYAVGHALNGAFVPQSVFPQGIEGVKQDA